MIDRERSSARVLDPHDRISEVLFGLIMVLAFTGSLSVATADRAEVRTMLVGALGCNLAWGIIDAVLYLMASLAEKGRDLKTWRAVVETRDQARARELIAGVLPAVLASVLKPEELDAMHERLRQETRPPDRAALDRTDLRGALGVFLLVFAATFPVAMPFVFMHDVATALRASNAIAIVMLFGLGYAFGRHAGSRPWVTGTAMVLLGAVLVAITIALGG